MPHGAGHRGEDQVGLVEQVAAVGGVVVRGQAHLRPGGVHGAREAVLVELVVVDEAGPVAEGEPEGGLVLQGGAGGVDLHGGVAHVGVAEEGGDVRAGRAPLEGGDAAVHGPLVVEVLVPGAERGARAGGEGDGGVEPVAPHAEPVAEPVGVLVHAVEARGDGGAEPLAQVHAPPPVAERPSLDGEDAGGRPLRFLAHPVQHAAAAAPPEHHGVGALEGLHALGVVQVAEVLRVVPHAVHEEVGGGGVAADGGGVAVPLPLPHGDAGDVAHHVGHPLHRLVGDELGGDDAGGLRSVAQRGVGAGGGGGPPGGVPAAPGADDGDGRQGVGGAAPSLAGHQHRLQVDEARVQPAPGEEPAQRLDGGVGALDGAGPRRGGRRRVHLDADGGLPGELAESVGEGLCRDVEPDGAGGVRGGAQGRGGDVEREGTSGLRGGGAAAQHASETDQSDESHGIRERKNP